ncbi:unnamed protein product [Lactuca virosa]|uniref:Uncharacterized protein n=1 Tax=Lactuca virosa TaxID=75947 RepID=A0AAU9LMA9_9ASTR|nr:unnamed protein product [Lactuca virosa]
MKKIFIFLAFSPKLNRKKDNFQLQQPHQKIGLNGYSCYLGKIGKKNSAKFQIYSSQIMHVQSPRARWSLQQFLDTDNH